MTDKPDNAPENDQDGPDQSKPSIDKLGENDSGSVPKAGTRATPSSAAHKESAPKPETAESESATKPSARPTAKGGAGRFVVWLIVVLMVAGGAVAAAWPILGPHVMSRVEPYWAQVQDALGLAPRPTQARLPSESAPQAPPAPQPQTVEEAAPEAAPQPTEVPAREPQVQTDMAQTDMGPAPVPEVTAESRPGDAAALVARLTAMENQLSDLSASADSGAVLVSLQHQLDELAQRLDALEAAQAELMARPRDLSAPAQALVLAATQLRARLSGDGPFESELEALVRIAGDDPVVADIVRRLRPHAKVGVPSEGALIAKFAKVASEIMRARASGDAGWLGQVKAGLGGLITVRRTDPAKISDEAERAVAITEAALELGDLNKAVDALGQLHGPAAEAAAPWLGEAHARVEVDRAVDDLHRHALATLAAAGSQ